MNPHTLRALSAAQQGYLAFTKECNSEDLTAWISHMQSRGLAVNTIRQRICLVRQWLGREVQVTLPTRHNVRDGKWLNSEQVQAMLAAIPNNESGRHDFVLITVLLITGLRVGQVRTWRWSDFKYKSGFSGSNNKIILPIVIPDVLQLIYTRGKDSYPNNMHLSLTAYGEDYLFTATHKRAPRQPILPSNNIKRQPLSPQEINRRIKRYARLAGLETQGINAECLRRTHKELGENIIINLVQNSLTQRKAGPVRWKKIDRDARLHGIGRRGRRA